MRTKRNSLVLALALASGVASAQKPSVEIAVLREELLLPDADRALGAVDKLRRARGAAATDALLDALALGLSPRVALAALDALRERRASAALDVLIRYAHHRDAVARAAATSALGALDDRRAIEAVRAALGDADRTVRAAAGEALAARRDRTVVPALLVLLGKGDEAAVKPLAELANAETAARVGELTGRAPDAVVAQCLGHILLRPDLGPEKTYVEIVRAIGKIPGDDAIVALTGFIGSLPPKSARPAKREAQAIVDERVGTN
ncbi:MAG TPA: HEAT repeat domain-containing protein [Haliangiales bacterium]|nr:HEAT repeat domain-containing protein [Haliangiales bacterium]